MCISMYHCGDTQSGHEDTHTANTPGYTCVHTMTNTYTHTDTHTRKAQMLGTWRTHVEKLTPQLPCHPHLQATNTQPQRFLKPSRPRIPHLSSGQSTETYKCKTHTGHKETQKCTDKRAQHIPYPAGYLMQSILIKCLLYTGHFGRRRIAVDRTDMPPALGELVHQEIGPRGNFRRCEML